MKIISILGTYHTGSTALCAMLGKHPDCFAVGELYRLGKLLNNYPTTDFNPRCSCRSKPCPFWKKVATRVNNSKDPLTIISNQSGSKIIIDDSKRPEFIKPYLKNHRVDFILLSKSPERYVASCLKYRQVGGREQDINSILDQWIKHNQEALDFIKGKRIIKQKFIRLATDPEGALERLCNFIGVEYLDGLQDYWLNEDHHILGGNAKVIVSFNDVGSHGDRDKKEYEWARKNWPEYKKIFRKRFSESFNPDAWKKKTTPRQHRNIWEREDVRAIARILNYEKLTF